MLADGLRLWRGTVLADFPDETFLQAERARLEELRLVAQEDRATAELALGRHAAVAAELERLVAVHRFREGLHGLRMLALYRSRPAGRRHCRRYQAAGRALRDELGIDPVRICGSCSGGSCSSHRSWTGHRLERPVEPPARRGGGPRRRGPAVELVGRGQQLAALQTARGPGPPPGTDGRCC